VGARFSASVQTGTGAHPASCTMGTGSFPGVKSGRGVTLTPHNRLVPGSRKSRAVPLLPVWAVRPAQRLSACTTVHFTFTYSSTPGMGRTACTEPQCLYNGALYLYLSSSSILECYAVSIGNQLSTYQKIASPSQDQAVRELLCILFYIGYLSTVRTVD